MPLAGELPVESPAIYKGPCAGGSSKVARRHASALSRGWTCARAAFITTRRAGMARRARSYWSCGATIILAKCHSIRCVGV